MIERELRFTARDMEGFAAASGDHSPLHMDPAFARRTAFGRCIVFGGLETIAMLGTIPAEALTRVRSVRSQFPGPVLPGERLTAQARNRPNRPEDWEVRLTGRGKLLARLVASSTAEAPLSGASGRERNLAWPQAQGIPTEIAADYRTGPELLELARRFDVTTLDPAVLDGVAWASHVVGMSLPGFNGLCAAVSVVAAPNGAGEGGHQRLRLVDYDERSDRLLIEGVLEDAHGTPRVRGTIECFPFSPTPLPASAALSGLGEPETVGGKVVVTGGSRGIGAALALALLSRGYEVHVLYARSVESVGELRRLAGEFGTRLFDHRLDVADPEAVALAAEAIGGPIEGLALCAATPPLPMELTGESALALTEHLASDFRLAAVPLGSFLPRLRRPGAWMLFCSAPAVSDPLRDLPQSTVTKLAIEGLARWAAKAAPGARVLVARPPRTATDLVNTPSARLAAAPPDAVAGALIERLLGADSGPGLEIVEPEVGAASAT